MSLAARRRIATLDLRIDYVRPALPQQEVICDAHCYKVTRYVAFVRAAAHHGDKMSPIATASGTFVVFRDEGRRAEDGGSA
jgi:acyl-coenzyme A thioesterase PaaI-like protein